MPAPIQDIAQLIPMKGNGKGRFSHNVSKGTLPGSNKSWFNKEMDCSSSARLEILAQEFFRLIIPHQPETRIASHFGLGIFYILSEEVAGYKSLPKGEQAAFTKGTYTGLGQAMMTALFVQEIDMKEDNIGLNSHNQVVKIDGDWTFVSIKDPDGYGNKSWKITPLAIKSLPFPIDFYTFNWLDIRKQEISYTHSGIVDASLTNAPHFREEINEAILKILLLPDFYLRNFVDAYIHLGVSADRYYNFLHNRREELKLSAMKNASFVDYLASEKAKEVAKAHLLHMKNFIANGSHAIVNKNDYKQLDDDFQQMADTLLPGKKIPSVAKPPLVASGLDAPVNNKQLATVRVVEQTVSPPEEIASAREPKNKVHVPGSLLSNTWKGFLAGFLIAASVITALVVLRVIDVFTFGLSLPLTIAASAGIVIAAGVGLGLMGGACQYAFSDEENRSEVVDLPKDSDPKKVSKFASDVKEYKDLTKKVDLVISPKKSAVKIEQLPPMTTHDYPVVCKLS